MLARLGAVALAISTAIGVAPHTVGAGDASCAVVWGSLAKVDADMSTGASGQHPSGSARVLRPHRVRHRRSRRRVRRALPGPRHPHCVRGADPLRGGAFLEVIVRVPADDDNGQSTYPRAGRRHLVNVSGFSTFRQAAWAGSQEGVTAVGLGVRARLPFRVFVLAGPGAGSRIVVDVAHHW